MVLDLIDMDFFHTLSSSTKIDNRKKDILILGKGPTQGLERTPSAEKMYSISFIERNKIFCLSQFFVFSCLLNGKEIHKFKAKDTEIAVTPLYLGNVLKDWSVDNIKKTGLNGYVYDFSVDYNAVLVEAIQGVRRYLIVKHNIV